MLQADCEILAAAFLHLFRGSFMSIKMRHLSNRTELVFRIFSVFKSRLKKLKYERHR